MARHSLWCSYALLLNKQQATYSHMFMMVKEAALNLGLELTPSSVLSDFEQALIHSISLQHNIGGATITTLKPSGERYRL